MLDYTNTTAQLTEHRTNTSKRKGVKPSMIISETMVLNHNVLIREIEHEDIPELYELIYEDEQPEWKKWDAPYFPLEHVSYTVFQEYTSKEMLEDGEPLIE